MSQERDVQATQFANACQRRPIPLRVETGAKWPNTDLWIDNLINLFLILPFLITSYLPLTDLPNHLERQHILSDLTTSPALQNYYHYDWQLVPNLGIDLFVLAARFVVPINLAVRVFCILGLSLIFWGSGLINRYYAGQRAQAYRFAPFLCYGGPVQFGFLNFVFGIGLALVSFGAYLRLRDAPASRLLAIFTPCGILLLLCHLMAFGICAIAIGAFELAHPFDGNGRSRLPAIAHEVARRELQAALFLLPPLAVFVLFSPFTAGGHGVRWSTLHEKIESIAALTLFASPGPELLLLALAIGGFAFLCLFGAVRVCRESITAGIIMLAVFLLLPRVATGGGYIDYRMPWAASFFLRAGVIPGRPMGRIARAVGVCFAGLVVASQGKEFRLFQVTDNETAGTPAACPPVSAVIPGRSG